MPVVIGLLVLALIVYIGWRALSNPGGGASVGAQPVSDRPFAFLSNGMIFFRTRGQKIEQLQSIYAQESADRRERSREKHSWKQNTSFGISAGGGMRSFEAADQPLLATSAAFEPGGSLLYFLRDEGIGGLFRRDAVTGHEQRVLLKPGLNLSGITPSGDGQKIAAASQQAAGVSNIVLLGKEGENLREVTGGDTVDSSPAWVPDAPQRLLFQSAGLARNEQGYIVAQGPASIQILNMETGTVAPIVDNPAFDYLKPRVAPGGHLMFIRRPYEAPNYGMSNVMLDMLLFPFRLLRAVFHYLNFFSMMYSRKPLTSASGPMVNADMKNILLQGKRIDAEKAMRTANLVHGVQSLVPKTWELVSRDSAGHDKVLATSVASYDIGPDGAIVYSNGRGVFVMEPDGSSRLALADELVGDVVAASV